jgi:hypothetical protein
MMRLLTKHILSNRGKPNDINDKYRAIKDNLDIKIDTHKCSMANPEIN